MSGIPSLNIYLLRNCSGKSTCCYHRLKRQRPHTFTILNQVQRINLIVIRRTRICTTKQEWAGLEQDVTQVTQNCGGQGVRIGTRTSRGQTPHLQRELALMVWGQVMSNGRELPTACSGHY